MFLQKRSNAEGGTGRIANHGVVSCTAMPIDSSRHAEAEKSLVRRSGRKCNGSWWKTRWSRNLGSRVFQRQAHLYSENCCGRRNLEQEGPGGNSTDSEDEGRSVRPGCTLVHRKMSLRWISNEGSSPVSVGSRAGHALWRDCDVLVVTVNTRRRLPRNVAPVPC